MRQFIPKQYVQQDMKYDLKRFWRMVEFSTTQEFKINLLKEYSNKKYFYTYGISRNRKHFNNIKHKNKNISKKLNNPCFVCFEDSECRHHIISIKNGGTNGKRNIVQLCNNCHSEIHPWLKGK